MSAYDIVHKIRCEAREEILKRYRDAHFDRQQAGYDAVVDEKTRAADRFDKTVGVEIARFNVESDRLAAREAYLNARDDELSAGINFLRAKLQEIVDAHDAVRDKKATKEQVKLDKLSDGEVEKELGRLRKASRERKDVEGEREKLKLQILHHNSGLARLQELRVRHYQELKRISSGLDAYASLEKFRSHEFAYSLRLEIEEINDAQISTADLTWPITYGAATIGFAVGDKKQRKAKREVRVAAKFSDLVALEKKCDDAKGLADESKDFRFPIIGRIGLDEVIAQYLEIQEKSKLSASVGAGQLYTSVITFTTTVSGALKPSVTVSRVAPRKFSGGGALSASRADTHEVTIVMLPPPEPKTAEPEKVYSVHLVDDGSLVAARR